MPEYATHDSRFQPLMTLQIGETLPVEEVGFTNRTVLILPALKPVAGGNGTFQRVEVHTFAKVTISSSSAADDGTAPSLPAGLVWRRID
jgi:hypothetical protein